MINLEFLLGPKYSSGFIIKCSVVVLGEDFSTSSLYISLLNFDPFLRPCYWSADHDLVIQNMLDLWKLDVDIVFLVKWF